MHGETNPIKPEPAVTAIGPPGKVDRTSDRIETVLAVIILFVIFGCFMLGIFEAFEVRTIDYRFQSRGLLPESRDIVMIPITTDCLAENAVGPWPWTRDIHAGMIDYLGSVGVKATGFDVLFKSRMDLDGDAALVAAARKMGRVVLAEILDKSMVLDPGTMSMIEQSVLVTPFADLSAVAAGLGFINVDYETMNQDGVVRKIILTDKAEGRNTLSLGVALFMASRGIPRDNARVTRNSIDIETPEGVVRIPLHRSHVLYRDGEKEFLGLKIPWYSLREDIYYLINYSGESKSGRFEEVAFSNLYSRYSGKSGSGIAGDDSGGAAAILKNRLILVGPKASLFADMKVTPFGLMPGMEVHASILKNILEGKFLRRPGLGANFLIMALACMGCLILVRKTVPRPRDIILVPLLAAIYFWVAVIAFSNFGIVLEIVPVVVIILATSVITRFYQMFIKLLVTNRKLFAANRALDRKIREVTHLYEASRSLNVLDDLDLVIDTVLNNACKVVDAAKGFFFVFDEDTEKLVLKSSTCENLDFLGQNEVAIGEGIVGKCGKDKAPLLFERGTKGGQAQKLFDTFPGLMSLLLVPVTLKTRLTGVLVMMDRQLSLDGFGEVFDADTVGFFDSDVNLIQAFASQAAITVENARLYKLAVFDGLTKLYVHRFFQGRLAQEFKRTMRYRQPLAVLLSDIDHFKKFNDMYGHQVGDIVLEGTADVFKKSVRDVDLVARYGGEEFAVILPQTDEPGAVIVAERIRKAVESFDFLHPDGRILKVTVSIGIAAYTGDEDIPDTKTMVKRSDMALYYAKENGRNRCVPYRLGMEELKG